MKSDSKIYRFFFGKRGEKRLPFGVMLLILVPILIVGQYFQNRKYNALSANPFFTSTVVSDVYSLGNSPYLKYQIFVDGKAYEFKTFE